MISGFILWFLRYDANLLPWAFPSLGTGADRSIPFIVTTLGDTGMKEWFGVQSSGFETPFCLFLIVRT